MPDPTDQLNQLDLQNLPPEEAAKLIRAHAAALQQQQHHAMLGMLGTVPELQKAGEAEYAQAGRERGTTQELGGQVLKQTLEQTSQERQLAALQQQIEFQRGQLGLQGKQLDLEAKKMGADLLRPFLGPLLEASTKSEEIDALASHFGKLGTFLGGLAKVKPDARIRAVRGVLGDIPEMSGETGVTPKKGGGKVLKQAIPPKAAPPAATKPATTADKWDAMRQKYGGLAAVE